MQSKEFLYRKTYLFLKFCAFKKRRCTEIKVKKCDFAYILIILCNLDFTF